MATAQAALAAARAVGGREVLGRILANLGAVYAALDQPAQAAASYEEAMAVLDTVRAQAGSEAGRTGFAERYIDVYSSAVALYHRQGDDRRAFDTSERGRSRAFLDSLATGQVQLSDSAAGRSAGAAARTLCAPVGGARCPGARGGANAVRSQADGAAPGGSAMRPERAYTDLLDSIGARGDRLGQLTPGRQGLLDLPALQALLDDQTTLVAYYFLGDPLSEKRTGGRSRRAGLCYHA